MCVELNESKDLFNFLVKFLQIALSAFSSLVGFGSFMKFGARTGVSPFHSGMLKVNCISGKLRNR